MLRGLPFLIVLVTALWSSTAYSGGRRQHFVNLTEKDGFLAGSVTAMLEDKKGFIWYGSQNGLFRYDGYSVQRFASKYGVANSLSGNTVSGLAEDKLGNIWIATAGNGLNRYDPIRRIFTRYYHTDGKQNSLVTDRLRYIACDSRNRLWIGYQGKGWSIMDISTGKLRHFKAPSLFTNYYGFDASNLVGPMLEDEGGMWITTDFGLHYHRNDDSIFTYTNTVTNINEDNLFISICRTSDTTLWVGTWGAGIKEFNTRTRSFRKHTFAGGNPLASIHNIVLSLAHKSDSELWVGTADNGLGYFNLNSYQFSFVPHDANNPKSPLPGECYSLLKDRRGTLWAGFYTGISRLSAISSAISFTEIQHYSPEYTAHLSPMGFYKDPVSGLLYMGYNTGSGLYIVDEGKQLERVIKVPGQELSGRRGVEMVNIFSIVPHSADELLLSTTYGLRLFNKLTMKMTPVTVRDQDGRAVAPQRIIKRPEGYWCNGHPANGFYFISGKLDSAVHYYTGRSSPVKLSVGRAHIVLAENDSTIWLAMLDSGLYRMNPRRNTMRPLVHPGNPPLFGRMLLKGKNGDYWFASEQQGVFHITPAAGGYRFRQITDDDGLASMFITNLVFDNAGNLVIGTEMGPSIMLPGGQIISFRNNNLMSNYRSTFGAVYADQLGNIYQSAHHGIASWHTDSLLAMVQRPHLYLSAVKVAGRDWTDTADADKLTYIELPHDKNNIELFFTALDYLAPAAVRYYHRLQGEDTSWVPFDRNLSFSQLAPGRYHLSVKAVNGLGASADRVINLEIRILPPFWRSWWFVLLCIVAVAVVVYAFFRYRLSVVKKEERLKSEFSKMVAEVEMKALRAQMNPHFLFNCLNSINRYIVVNDTVRASSYLTKFSKLIRLILDNSANDTASLESELNLLRLYIEMEAMRFEGQFSYTIDVDADLALETILIPTMIIQPYIENAIWHGLLNKGANGHLLLAVSKAADGELEVIVEDDGIGRRKARELKSKSTLKQKSYGMQITNARMEALNQLYDSVAAVEVEDLCDEAGQPSGTRVILSIPYREHTATNIVNQIP